MKRSTPAKLGTAEERRGRVVDVVAKAKASGEKVPRGIKLIGFRDLTPAERVYGKSLEPMAREIRGRGKAAAA